MNIELIKLILQRNPELKTLIKQGLFLTGYTHGGASGALSSIFLCKFPWSNNCIKAAACGYIPAGDVLIVSHDPKWSLNTNWQAYSAMNQIPS